MNVQTIQGRLSSPTDVQTIQGCFLSSPGVKWNGSVFIIDLDRVSLGFRDAVRDRVMVSLVNPKTGVAKMATYSHAITGICDTYIYKIKMRDSEDLTVVISNIN
jgi:hypothetical protein